MADFIMTIEDDDDLQGLLVDEDIETLEEAPVAPEPATNMKLKAKKAKKAKADDVDADADQLQPDFSFDIDATGPLGSRNGWDFTAARAMLRAGTKINYTPIDELIARKRGGGKGIAGKAEAVPEEDDEEDVEENESENENDDEEGEEENDDDDDEEEGDFVAAGTDDESEGDEDVSDDGEETKEASTGPTQEEDATDDIKIDGATLDDSVLEMLDQVRGHLGEDNIPSTGADDEEATPETAEEAQRKTEYFADEADNKPAPSGESFATMNLSRPIMKGLAQLGFTQPTAIQARAIPVALLGKDICGGAVTGSGKTAAFVVPLVERLLYRSRQEPGVRVLVLAPTRELAVQCHSVATKIAAFTDIRFCLCIGGLSLKAQELELRTRPDVVIATPGRLIDHVRNSRSFSLEDIEILVMDEADRMLEDGFKEELEEIIRNCPRSRQTMLFSATMTDNVDELIRLSLDKPVRLMVDSANSTTDNLTQEFIRIRASREEERPAILLSLCLRTFTRKCIIFMRSKVAAHQMKIVFGLLGLSAAELHGNLSQEQRLEALERFRDGDVDFLLATDLAARGLDIVGVETVINFNMPVSHAQYVHRIGRTARAGRSGRSITLAGEADRKILRQAIRSSDHACIRHRVVPPEVVAWALRKIDLLKPQVKEIMEEEKEDRSMRQAEMELAKASNLIQHKDEIYARPARTWFQSAEAKKNSRLEQYQKHVGIAPAAPVLALPKRNLPDTAGMSRKKRRRFEQNEEDKKEQADMMKSAKAAKRATLPGKLNKIVDRSASGKGGKGGKAKTSLSMDFSRDLTDRGNKGAGAKARAPRKSNFAGKGKANAKVANKMKNKKRK